MHNAPLLEVNALGKAFHDRNGNCARWVLRDLSFSLNEGEFVTVIGPSGSGKSTLLNLLAQIDAPSEGEIRLRGEIISAPCGVTLSPGSNGRVGYVMQDDNLLPWRTLRANVEYPLEIHAGL